MMYCYIGCILDRASCTENILSNCLLNYGSRQMGHDGVASGYPTPTSFRRLMGCERDPQDRGVTYNLHPSMSIYLDTHIST